MLKGHEIGLKKILATCLKKNVKTEKIKWRKWKDEKKTERRKNRGKPKKEGKDKERKKNKRDRKYVLEMYLEKKLGKEMVYKRILEI